MVNKSVVGILVGIVFAALLVGVLIGTMIGGGGGGGDGAAATDGTPTAVEATPLPETDSPTPTATPGTATAPTATATPDGTAVATATPDTPTPTQVRTTILPRRFDETRIENLVEQRINERRAADELDELERRGQTVNRVKTMARNHSVSMANAGSTVHTIGGQSSADRYERYDLYATCQWDAAGGDYIVTADDNALEAIGQTYAGQEYTQGGETRFNANETMVADAIVDRWWNQTLYHDRLTLPNANRIAVGVEITQSGEVYATANLC